jgi:hypothetical protein
MTVSAPQRSAQRSFSTSSSVPLLIGEAPMLALTLVVAARPIAIGSSLNCRCTTLAGITMRPAATSSRTCSGLRCGSRSATRFISGVITPCRANSSCVTQSSRGRGSGLKSQAVFADAAGMPGVSGELKVSAAPIWAFCAKLPGLVPLRCVEGWLAPCSGSSYFA